MLISMAISWLRMFFFSWGFCFVFFLYTCYRYLCVIAQLHIHKCILLFIRVYVQLTLSFFALINTRFSAYFAFQYPVLRRIYLEFSILNRKSYSIFSNMNTCIQDVLDHFSRVILHQLVPINERKVWRNHREYSKWTFCSSPIS